MIMINRTLRTRIQIKTAKVEPSLKKIRFPDSKVYDEWESVPAQAQGYLTYVKYSFQTSPFILMVVETAWNKNMFIPKDMIWSSIVIFCYLALNLTLSAFGHVVWVPIDFKDWWAALYICVFLGIAGVSVVLPIYVNNWWSKEITSRTVHTFFWGALNFISKRRSER